MAGTNSDFDAAAFRTAIREAMTMGEPNEAADKVTFRWLVEKTYAKQSPTGTPYNYTSSPTSSDSLPDVQVPVAKEFTARTSFGRDTPLGRFDPSHVTLTILDEDYDKVFGLSRPPDQVIIGGSIYRILTVNPTIGLFGVDVYQLQAQAIDEA